MKTPLKSIWAFAPCYSEHTIRRYLLWCAELVEDTLEAPQTIAALNMAKRYSDGKETGQADEGEALPVTRRPAGCSRSLQPRIPPRWWACA